LFTAAVATHFTDGGVAHWTAIFSIPCALTILCAVGYLLLVKEPQIDRSLYQGAGGQ
jgi:hypothetical protein